MRSAHHRLAIACVAGLAAVSGVPGQEREWRFSPTPTLTIGGETDARTQFQYIRGVARLSTGEVVVANGGTNEIRVFDARGQYLRTLARTGDGPGEFRSLYWLGTAADSVVAWDMSQRRVSVFSGTAFARSQDARSKTIGPDGGDVIARFPNGTLLLKPFEFGTTRGKATGTYRDTVMIGTMARAADSVRWWGRFPNFTHLAYNPDNAPNAKFRGYYRFGPQTFWAVSGERVWIGDSGRDTLYAYDRDGKIVGRIRVPIVRGPFDEPAFDRARQRDLSATQEPRSIEAIQVRYDRRFRPATAPLYERLLVARDGNLWIGRYRADPLDASEYVVVEPSGRAIARVKMPAGFTPHEIGADYVLGVVRDDDGVETLAMYSLTR